MKIFIELLIITMLLAFQHLGASGQTLTDATEENNEKDTLVVPDVDAYPVYNGDDLGLTYKKNKSVLKVWSPPASKMTLTLYAKDEEGEPLERIRMKRKKDGVWVAKLKGDRAGTYYTFQATIEDSTFAETPDPYAVATGVNGKRAMIVDLEATNPAGWENDKRPPLNSYSDIILYELHLRDISIHKNSGIKEKGKFLGLAETGTTSADGLSTGLDHIKELGVTHVHLLPVFDFRSIDENFLFHNRYNWGYDPQNYNVPEGSYATDVHDGNVRIREFKQLIKTMHDNGLRVVMDVVYNHTGDTEGSVFNQLVPFYYYRMKENEFSNASACGNETASERPMFRKFMLESMKYWVEEYHIDGFRIDLMGIHDIETLNMISRELRAIDPSIFIYGEGWTGGESTLPEEKRAVKVNTLKLDKIAAFSDEVRDGIKGHVFSRGARGFVTSGYDLEESVKFGIVGAIQHPQINYEKVNYADAPWANEPVQCIVYASCHDNHTLWDRLKIAANEGTEEDWLNMDKLAQTIVLTSQGVPFLHAGEEFVRTKFGVENSFESPDHINQINWDHKKQYADLFEYYKQLIQLRKNHPAFRMGNAGAVRSNLSFIDVPHENIIGYEINGAAVGDTWKRILVLFNGNRVGKQVDIPEGNWKIICQNYRIVEGGMGNIQGKRANLLPYSAFILAEE